MRGDVGDLEEFSGDIFSIHLSFFKEGYSSSFSFEGFMNRRVKFASGVIFEVIQEGFFIKVKCKLFIMNTLSDIWKVWDRVTAFTSNTKVGILIWCG